MQIYKRIVYLYTLCILSFIIIHYTAVAEKVTTLSAEFKLFYAPWCSHCKSVIPVWKEYSEDEKVNEKVVVSQVDCSEQTEKCADEFIKAYPTFILFIGEDKYTYRGRRVVQEFTKFVDSHLEQYKDVQVIPQNIKHNKKSKHITEDVFYEFISEKFTFVDFYAPWCSHCRKLEPAWDALATYFQDSQNVRIVKVDCTSETDLCKTEEITGFPTLNLYKDGVLHEKYFGDRSLGSMVVFVETELAFGDDFVPPEENLPRDHEEGLIKDELKKEADRENKDSRYTEFEPLDHFKTSTSYIRLTGGVITKYINAISIMAYCYNPVLTDSLKGLEEFLKFADDHRTFLGGPLNCGREDNKDVCDSLNIRSYPKVVFLTQGYRANHIVFQKEITQENLREFAKALFEKKEL